MKVFDLMLTEASLNMSREKMKQLFQILYKAALNKYTHTYVKLERVPIEEALRVLSEAVLNCVDTQEETE